MLLAATILVATPALQVGTCSGAAPRRSAVAMQDVPSIIVGGGRIGSSLLDMGMEGDVLLAAPLWETPVGDARVELTTRQSSGAALDRYSILESTHLHTVRMRCDDH